MVTFLVIATALLLVTALFVVALPVPARAETPNAAGHPCIGRWIGTGSNGGLPWGIDMTVGVGTAECGRIEYDSPELDCGGPLVSCALEGAGGQATEHYVHNVGCTAPGMVEFHCEGETMQWLWRGSGLVVRSSLRRVSGGTAADSSTPQPTSERQGNEGPTPTAPPVGDNGDPERPERPRQNPTSTGPTPVSPPPAETPRRPTRGGCALGMARPAGRLGSVPRDQSGQRPVLGSWPREPASEHPVATILSLAAGLLLRGRRQTSSRP